MLYDYFDKHADYKPSISNPFRSKTTIVIDTKKNLALSQKNLQQKDLLLRKDMARIKRRRYE